LLTEIAHTTAISGDVSSAKYVRHRRWGVVAVGGFARPAVVGYDERP
jgi:hypothetical protein